MPIFGWIRDALGIRKDVADTKKTKLEIDALEVERQQRRALIQPASLEDVKKYDPKFRLLASLMRSVRRMENTKEQLKNLEERLKNLEERLKNLERPERQDSNQNKPLAP